MKKWRMLPGYLWRRFRNKSSTDKVREDAMKRDLGVIKLTILGIGSTIGAGIYVVLGIATKNVAGPSIVLSFLVAGLSTLLSSLCFAQYALRVQNGGLYQYVFRTYGQYSAFIAVWAALIGAALMAAVSGQGISNCVDSFLNQTISNFTREYIAEFPSTIIFTEIPNVLGCIFVIVATIIVSKIEVNNFSAIINFLAILNSSVLCLFIAIGLVYGSFDNWTHSPGGFFSFGTSGVLRGAALGFTAYGGFEFICMAAQEAKDPARTVPRALVACVACTTVINTGTAVAFTLLVPYWLVDVASPLVGALEYVNLRVLSLIMFAGPVVGMLCSMVLGIYAVSRLLYSIAEQGLIDARLATLSTTTKSPVTATLTTGFFVSIVALFFKIDNLASLVTSGVLMIMTFVSFGTLHLFYGHDKSTHTSDTVTKNKSSASEDPNHVSKYRPYLKSAKDAKKTLEKGFYDISTKHNVPRETVVSDDNSTDSDDEQLDVNTSTAHEVKMEHLVGMSIKDVEKPASNLDFDKEFGQTKSSNIFTRINLSFYVCIIFFASIAIACVFTFFNEKLVSGQPVVISISITCLFILILASVVIATYPRTASGPNHSLPMGPLVPVLSGFFNVFFFIGGLDSTGVVLFLLLISLGTFVWVVVCVVDFSRQTPSYKQIVLTSDSIAQPDKKVTSAPKEDDINNKNIIVEKFDNLDFIDLESTNL